VRIRDEVKCDEVKCDEASACRLYAAQACSGEKIDTTIVLPVWLTWRPNGKICFLPRICERITSIHCFRNDQGLSPMIFRRAGSNVTVKLKDKSGMFYSDQPVQGFGLGMKGPLYSTRLLRRRDAPCMMHKCSPTSDHLQSNGTRDSDGPVFKSRQLPCAVLVQEPGDSTYDLTQLQHLCQVRAGAVWKPRERLSFALPLAEQLIPSQAACVNECSGQKHGTFVSQKIVTRAFTVHSCGAILHPQDVGTRAAIWRRCIDGRSYS
jgi:hypothetical protein